MSLTLRRRDTDPSLPLAQRLYLARGADPRLVGAPQGLADLLAPSTMKGMDEAARIVSEALMSGQSTLIYSDFDVDGCLAASVLVLGLRQMGHPKVDYFIPDRMTLGYGLGPAGADLAHALGTEVLITADNGISSLAGVARARALGTTVVVSDHHGCPDQLPDAHAIINPQQPGCGFASKGISGCGVAFYLLLAVRARLKAKGWFDGPGPACPNLSLLLDLVAIATVGDMVPLDGNNRILVSHGLKLIRAGVTRPGVLSLLNVAGGAHQTVTETDFGFKVCPRINSAGRMENMRTGVECILADDPETASQLALQLDTTNRQRRNLQAEMAEAAAVTTARFDKVPAGITLYDPSFHAGVVGLVATRIKDEYHRPTLVLAPGENGMLKGSGRSIPGFHLRDALAAVQAMPDPPLEQWGGHSQAVGFRVAESNLPRFMELFEKVCERSLTPELLSNTALTDGELSEHELTLEAGLDIERAGPWGQAFEPPLFEGEFRVEEARTMGADGEHVRYRVRAGRQMLTAVHFKGIDQIRAVGQTLPMTFRMNVNRYKGSESLQLIADHVFA